MSKILTPAQSEAVYSAMCALNNVGGRITAQVAIVDAGTYVNVYETSLGIVFVTKVCDFDRVDHEEYESQSAFATAYDLATGA